MTKQDFKNILSSYVAEQQSYINEHNEIKAILLPLVGKPINGRTLNKKVLGEKFTFSVEYGSLCYVKGEYTHLIGYANSENIIAVEPIENISRGFNYFDACNGRAAQDRIHQIQNMDFDKAFGLFSEIEKSFNKLRELFGKLETSKLGSYYFPAYYDVLNTIYTPEKNHSSIKLSDFYYIRKN
jgi:hypothetical protein